jgi:cytochrome c-type biogenesis protein CcsB
MASLENISLLASLVSVALALVFSIIDFIARRQAARSGKSAAVKTYALVAPVPVSGFNWAAIAAVFASIIFLSLTIISRTIQTGYGPFSNMYEFAIAFAWGIIVAGLIFRWRYRTAAILNIGLIVSLLLLIFAVVQYSKPASLVPALQQSALLSAHVASAVVAYGTLTIGFGAAILFLVQNRRNSPWLPEAEMLDNISYRAVIIGFPFLTLLIVLGALWADIAWGKYWSWDPKETASLVTWLIYAAYMHARIMRGWRGNRAAILLIAGFAAILLTFFGNYIFSGLHTYG